MKKVLSIMFAVCILVASSVSAFAVIDSSEQAILDALSSGVQVESQTIYLPQEYINQAENYFNSPYSTVSQEECDKIIKQINLAKDAIVASGAKSYSEIINNSDLVNQIVAYGQSACDVLELKLVFDGSDVVITDQNGVVVFKTDNAAVIASGDGTGTGVIKATGPAVDATNMIVIGTAIVAMVGIAGFTAYKMKLVRE